MTGRPITEKQGAVLDALSAHPAADGPTVRNLADTMETARFGSPRFSYDEVYSQLLALERRGLASRRRGPRAWHWRAT